MSNINSTTTATGDYYNPRWITTTGTNNVITYPTSGTGTADTTWGPNNDFTIGTGFNTFQQVINPQIDGEKLDALETAIMEAIEEGEMGGGMGAVLLELIRALRPVASPAV